MYSCTSLIHIQQCSFKHIISLQKRIEWKRFAFVHFRIKLGLCVSRNVHLFMNEKNIFYIHLCQDVNHYTTMMSNKNEDVKRLFIVIKRHSFHFVATEFNELEKRKFKSRNTFNVGFKAWLTFGINCLMHFIFRNVSSWVPRSNWILPKYCYFIKYSSINSIK